MYPAHWRGQEGPTTWPLCFPDLNPIDSTLVYTTPVNAVATFQQQVEDDYQTTFNIPGNSECLW